MRPYRHDDAPALLTAVQESLERVGRWLPWCHAGYSLEDARSWIEACAVGWAQGGHYAFAVFDAATNTFVGAAGLNQFNRQHRFANLGYWTRTSWNSRGVASAAARRVAAFGFAELALERIEICCDVDNDASRRAAEKAGARFEGIARRRLLGTDGHTHNAAMYALIAEDFAAQP